ncbi:MAG: SAM-dependent DNA methyltransferase [Planctomycetes bacterium]|nr:SAM-dependent DNA methyltransferase [Planctomycetota bacterium]
MPANNSELEKRLWSAADELRANSNLTSSQYSIPVLGLIFLRFADYRFSAAKVEIYGKAVGRRLVGKTDYQAQGVMYLPEEARFKNLIAQPEGANIGKAINDAMRAIEDQNEDLKDVLPKTYNRFDNRLLMELLKIFNSIPMDLEGDAFGRIYEYFLGKFALGEGQRGGEYFTPITLVKLMVEIIEPYHGYILDPASGSGGMFVQSAEFVRRRQRDPMGEISICGQERVAETVRLCRMNLAVHNLHGDIRQGNSYYEDNHSSPGRFDFVMANPPFNVNNIDKERLKDDRAHYPFGMPRPDNGNYLWIQLFYSSLNDKGRAGFVMANSASDARQSELEIRKALIQAGAVDVMVAIGSNFFYNVTLPVTLWFLDRGKSLTPGPLAYGTLRGPESGRGVQCADTVLFLDARSIFSQIDRAHREFTLEQIQLLASIVRLYRGENLNGFVFDRANYNLPAPQLDALEAMLSSRQYADVAGLCRVASRAEIEAQGWSLNPGRYVGVAEKGAVDFDFMERLEELNEKLEQLNDEAHYLEYRISENFLNLFG